MIEAHAVISHTSGTVLDPSDRKLLLKLAREQIEAVLDKRQPTPPAPTPALQVESGAFVTLHLRADAGLSLRGCIGQIESTGTLYETVKSVAHSAAFSDHRFSPLTVDELPSVELEISVLSPLHRIAETLEIQPGEHGLFMRRGARSGLLLPQVASERNWDRDTFLTQTCKKAGLPGDCWQDSETEIYTFTAEVFDEASAGM
jgi:AmmeMemoRadiSam system protein A